MGSGAVQAAVVTYVSFGTARLAVGHVIGGEGEAQEGEGEGLTQQTWRVPDLILSF